MKTARFAVAALFAFAVLTMVAGCSGGDNAAAPPAPQYLSNYGVEAWQGDTIVASNPYGPATVPSGAVLRFMLNGSGYLLGDESVTTQGGFDYSTVTWSFRAKNEVGSGGYQSNYIPCVIPTGGTTVEGYKLFRPADGTYLVTGSFTFPHDAGPGRETVPVTMTTTPLCFQVGPDRVDAP